VDSGEKDPRQKLLIATPTLGVVRVEWAAARWGQVIPCNWSNGYMQVGLNTMIPKGYLVAEAQNLAVQELVDKNYEWLFLHEDDVMLPPDAFIKINEYMRKADVPVVSGLYYTKSRPSEPLVYRGRGNSYFGKWKQGDKVWVDGVPTGCLLIHGSILRLMHKESEEYLAINRRVRRVFETPRKVWFDPEECRYGAAIGTSDLYWCDRVVKEKVLERAGWKKIAKEKYQFLVDTSLMCRHIDLTSGSQYP
jgi:hypothetical protein